MFIDELIPCEVAVVYDVVVEFEDAVRKLIVAHELPDGVDWVELRTLVVMGCYAPEVRDAVEESFDCISLAVESVREGEALLSVGARLDVGQGILGCGGCADGIAVVALVRKQRCTFGDGVKQRFGFLAIVDLTGGQVQCDETTVSVNKCMYLLLRPPRERPMMRCPAPPACPLHPAGKRGRSWRRSSRSCFQKHWIPLHIAGPTPRHCACPQTDFSKSSGDLSAPALLRMVNRCRTA